MSAPQELYSFKTIDIDQIHPNDVDTGIVNRFWHPDLQLRNKLITYFGIVPGQQIVDVGCGNGSVIFPNTTHIVGLGDIANADNFIKINMDLDFDKFNYADNSFDFVYCRHTLEDIQNPLNAFTEITRLSKKGYIETPSPLVEITKGVHDPNYRGYDHHRYIIWSDAQTNTLYFLPKYPLFEYLQIDENLVKKFNHILNNYSVYWNNYYIWDHKNPPNIVVYRHGVNFTINPDHIDLINKAIYSSIEYTNIIIPYIASL